MLVAHDAEVLGLGGARAMHGTDVFDGSGELAQWLDGELAGTRRLGAPLSVQSIVDRARPMSRQVSAGVADGSAVRSQLASLLATWAVPLAVGRDIEQGIRDVLEHSPSGCNAAWFSGRSECVLWPGGIGRDLLEWQIAAEFGNTRHRSPALNALVDVTQNVHLAIPRCHDSCPLG